VNGRLVKLHEFVPKITQLPGPVVISVGAVAKGDPGTRDSLEAKRTTT